MSPFRLVRVRGPQKDEVWSLSLDRPTVVGYKRGEVVPDIDLWPDRRVSRRHARLRFKDGAWSIEDAKSKHGTLVGGHEIRGMGPTSLEPGMEIRMGDTVLMLAPSDWHRLRSRDLVVELDIAPTLNLSLVYCDTPVVSRLVVRNWGDQRSDPGSLEIEIPGCGRAAAIAIPALESGQSLDLPKPTFQFDHQALESLTERSKRTVSVRLDDHPLQSDAIACWVLAHNEWSRERRDGLATAAFVLPNHPLVAQVAIDACQQLSAETEPGDVLEAIYRHLFDRWHVSYLREPPCWESNSQKVRFPHQVLLDFAHRQSQGTCIDLALLIAACLEYRGLQPLIAILDMGTWRHALVGCWKQARTSLEPLLVDKDKKRLLDEAYGALWVEPTGCTSHPEYRMEYGPACTSAVKSLTEEPLIFVLDVAGARRDGDGIKPLPFAGEPRWSQAAEKALQAARANAEAAQSQLATVPLLLGLLSLEDGLTRQVVADRCGAIDVVQRLSAALPKQADPTPASTHYRDVVELACSRAKAEGSPLVLEAHLLTALLEVTSEALDKALKGLGTNRDELLKTLRAIRQRIRPDDPLYSAFSEFPSSF